MIIKYLARSFILLIPVGVCLYFYLLRIADFWGLSRKSKKVKMAAASLVFGAIIWSANLFGFGALLVLHLTAVALCMQIFNFFFVALHKYRGLKMGFWNKVFSCGLVPVIATGLILVYGYYSMEKVRETDYTIHTPKVIREQGYRIAMIADLHFGTTMDEEKLKKYCNEIEGKKPDMVVLCGDIVDRNTTQAQMENSAKILGNIKSSFGTFYVYGNHDKGRYASPNFNEEQLENALTGSGIHVLEDEVYNINDEFTIIGRRDKGFSSEYKRKSSQELLENVDIGNFLLLLDHQPSGFKENSKSGMDLELSGHTHAGQLWPEGLFNEITGVGELNYGYEKLDNFQVIVTSGIGGYGYPFRTGSYSEYVIVDVKR